MSRLVRVVVLAAALVSALGAVSSSAGAAAWDTSGNTAFTATGGPTSFAVTGAGMSCADATSTGTVPAGSSATLAFTITTSYACLQAGTPFTLECGQTFTGTSQSGAVTTGTLDATCALSLFTTEVCHFQGTRAVTYTNPSGTVNGSFTLATGGDVFTSNPSVGSCFLGNGERVHFTEQTWSITAASGGTGTGGPVITRTS